MGPTARSRVAIVDDDDLMRRSLARLLMRDYDLLLFADAASLLASSPHPDVILCDVNLRATTGLEVYRIVRARDEGLARRFIFLSGAEPPLEVRALGQPFLEKPCSGERIRATVRSLLPPPPAPTDS